MSDALLKVGEVAERTGLTVRALHHYEELGLLCPSGRTRAGHRLYGPREVQRLLRIVSLRALGVPLDRIGALLREDARSLPDALGEVLTRARAELHELSTLVERLERAIAALRAHPDSTVELLSAIEVMAMFEKYYDEAQRAQLEARRVALGDEGMQKAQADWASVIADAKSAHARGVPPESDEARAIGARWSALIEAFTGGDRGIASSLQRMYQEEPSVRQRAGVDDPALMAWVTKARGL